MRRSDIEALGDLAGDALVGVGAVVRDMHSAISRRPFEALGEPAEPVRLVHDGIAVAVHGGVRIGLRAAARGGARAAALGADPDAPPLAAGRRGSIALGALNGLYGDRLRRRGNGLALGLSVRRDGAVVALTPAALASAFPGGGPRVAVFVHGLGETDEAWRAGSREGFGERLRRDLGFVPVHVRYNTGLPVADNGRTLAGVLADLVAGWPGAVDELALVGHSMGGLVVRDACRCADRAGARWVTAVSLVASLGAPHRGADLEKATYALALALRLAPETRPLQRVLDARSAGIKNLRHGTGGAVGGGERDRFVAATIRRGPVGALVGDLLVRTSSASGGLPEGRELSGLHHFDLLGHPAVYEQLRDWLSRERPAPTRTRSGRTRARRSSRPGPSAGSA